MDMITGTLRFRPWRVGIVGVLALLAACGPTPSETQLNYASQQCSYGDGNACNALGQLSYQAQAERQQQDTNTALAVGVLALGGLAVGAALADDNDHGYYRRRNDGWGHRGYGRGRGRW
jgi:hypothetical protein